MVLYPGVIFSFRVAREITRRSREVKNNLWSHEYWTSFPCCAVGWKTHTFPKPISVVVQVSYRLGSQAFSETTRIVASFEEPISELGQILSQYDEMEMNFLLLWPEAGLSPCILVFQGYLFFQGASGARVVVVVLQDWRLCGLRFLQMLGRDNRWKNSSAVFFFFEANR